MDPHPYLCDCSRCEYERTIKRVREMQERMRAKHEHEFIHGTEDPFPNSGRFKVHQPYTQQKPRHSGKYRRVQDAALDVINWQYQPWPGHEWVTYFSVTVEMLHTAKNLHVFANQSIRNADHKLQLRRFYKVERVH